MADKKKADRYTSPKGIAKFPRLSEPDTKFKKDGEYSVKLLLSADDATCKDFCKLLDTITAEAFEEQKANLKPAKAKTLQLYVPYKEEEHHETGEPTGNIEFNFKTGAKYKDKKSGEMKDKKLNLFDSKGKLIETQVNVGGGSVVKVNFTPFSFYAANGNSAGASLRMNAVQILQLKTWGGASAEEYGFGKEEDGFEAETAEKFEDSAPAGDDGGGDY